MSKTVTEIGLIAGGLALAVVGGLAFYGLLSFGIGASTFSMMLGVGVSTTLSGVGLALRQNPAPVSGLGSVAFDSGTSPRRVIYGQFQAAGALTYASFPPSQNLATTTQLLHLVYTLAAHEISSFDGVAIDGTMLNFGTDIVWDAADGYWHLNPENYAGTSPPLNDFYWQHILFEFDFGRNQSLQPFPQLAAADPSWTSACIQQGCAKVHVVLRADSGWTAVFPSGQIPNIQFLVTGKKLIDPRVTIAWLPSQGYLPYQYIVDNGGRIWYQTNTGTSGSVRPNFEGASSFPTTLTDNTASWTTYGFFLVADAENCTDTVPQGHLFNSRLVNDAWSPNNISPQYFIIEAPLGYLQMQTSASGTSGTSEPNWGGGSALGHGVTTTDNTVTWTCLGRSPHAINPANSALCVNDYLQDTDAGLAATAASVDTASVIAAANVCEEPVVIIWNADNTLVYEFLYTCNGMFDYSSVRGNVLTSLCKSMAGWVIPPGDMWHVFAGAYVTPAISLTDADMRGPIKGDFRLSKREVANSIKGKYVPSFLPTNPAATLSLTQVPPTWHAQSFPPYQANGLAGKPNYLNTEDGGQVIWQDVQFDFTTSLWTAQRLAKIELMRLRFQETLVLPCKLTALDLEAGDPFYFTHSRWGIASGVYQISQCSITFDSSGGKDAAPVVGVDLTVRQVDPSIYSFTAPSSSTNYGEYSSFGVTGVMSGTE